MNEMENSESVHIEQPSNVSNAETESNDDGGGEDPEAVEPAEADSIEAGPVEDTEEHDGGGEDPEAETSESGHDEQSDDDEPSQEQQPGDERNRSLADDWLKQQGVIPPDQWTAETRVPREPPEPPTGRHKELLDNIGELFSGDTPSSRD